MAKKKKKKKSISNKGKKKNTKKKRKVSNKKELNKKRKKASSSKKKKNTSKSKKSKSKKKKKAQNSSQKKRTTSYSPKNSKNQTTSKRDKDELENKKTKAREITQKEKKNIDVSLIVRLIVVIILIFILMYSGYNIAIWLIDNSKTAKIQNEIINNIEIEEITNASDNNSNETSYINVDITSLKETNNDSVGWIQVLGTDINYPIVQSTDNEYYLTHDYLKNANKRGWIFLDYHNNLDNLSRNNIIYGHRNANGSMFGTLKNVLTDEWLENDEYHTIKISSLNYNYLFEVVSVYTISVETYYMTTSFSTEDEYQDFLNTIIARSIYDFDIEVSTDDYLITLSTCTGDGTKRLVVHARLKSYIEKE